MGGDDEQARRERAERLREELDALRGSPRRPPRSPREFLDEQARKERESDEDHPESPPPSG
jgi:hypothetical protein